MTDTIWYYAGVCVELMLAFMLVAGTAWLTYMACLVLWRIATEDGD